MDKTLSQVCSTDDDESKGIIVDDSSTVESKSEFAHNNIEKEKDANNEAEYEEPPVTYDPVFNMPNYFNILKCGNNLFNKLDATYKQACMVTPKDKHNTELSVTITNSNDHNGESLSNDKIRDAIIRFIVEEGVEAHNATMDTFFHPPITSNTQGENANAILTSEILNNSGALVETLKILTVKDAGYYDSDQNDKDGDPVSNPKVGNHTSDINKIKVTVTSSRHLQQKLLINRTLPITTMTIDPRIPDRVATCGGTPHARTMPTTKPVITDAACSSAHVI